ncbi:S-adenosyl-L-methionine-dependent methyltransferase [Viridothelium virens]|uniref:S-adenosyl-L-methionine-dependent methyltransferase n=1 Tax=Viridothelium virens TaxID=1048519 RepID=A0A6A6H7F6_VIRVR|nr:S-adenosyl-L-methionine-dependent methyltransferase [Viridothelium virens]
MDELVNSIQRFADKADDVTRRQLSSSLRDLSVAFESPNDTMHRIVYQPIELAITQVAVDLGIFRLLSRIEKPISAQEVAGKTGADPVLINRILRFLASFRIIAECGEGVFEASHVTKTLAEPGAQAGVGHHFYFFNPILQILPKWLKEHHYQNVSSSFDCPFQRGFNTDQPLFLWMQHQPELLGYFVPFMNDYHKGKPVWTTVARFDEQCQGWNGERPLFVDVGGGIGSQCLEFQQAAPKIAGRVILQDLQQTLDQSPTHNGIEKMTHDFFTPQPIEGAKYYYLRNILHDYPDNRCVQILNHIMSAMSSESIILINELVVPQMGAHWQATQMDLAMMCALGSMERTERQWRTLLAQAGMKITRISTYGLFMGDSLIEAVLE